MVYLILSIVCSVAVSVLLKLARKRGMVIEQAVAVNYLVALLWCVLLLQPNLGEWRDYLSAWWLFMALGILLPLVFVVMARAVEHAGIVRSDAAQRLSLFLPVLAAFIWFGERLSVNRFIGLALALVALLCLLWKRAGTNKSSGSLLNNMGWLLGVWVGYGVIDILFKQVATMGGNLGGHLLISFGLAGILMFGWLFGNGSKWSLVSVAGGLLLGCLNFANILFYIRAHQAMSANPTLVFAGMNIGVITLGTLVGACIFKEKIHAVNAAGITVAVAAVLCLFYWTQIGRWLGI